MSGEEKGGVGRLQAEALRAEAALLLERAERIDAGLRPPGSVNAEAMFEVRDEGGAALVAAIREGRQGLGRASRLLSRMPNGSGTKTFRCLADCGDQLDALLVEMQPVYVVKL